MNFYKPILVNDHFQNYKPYNIPEKVAAISHHRSEGRYTEKAIEYYNNYII